MDPLAVLRTIWRLKWFAIPAIVITIVAAVAVYQYGPRVYESSVSYAIVNPKTPTEVEIREDPALGDLNSDNPYLRSSDPDLIANVLIARLNAAGTQDQLKKLGLSTEFLASSGAGGSGLIVSITASGDSPRQSLDTTKELGSLFVKNLRAIQTVSGADDRYLFTSLIIDRPDSATEKLSSRLRTVIVVAIAGVILVFGSVSLGSWIETARKRRAQDRLDAAEEDLDDDELDEEAREDRVEDELEVDPSAEEQDTPAVKPAPRPRRTNGVRR